MPVEETVPCLPVVFNEIAHSAMKSSLRSDEICFADEIKSVLAPDGVGFHHEVICSVRKDGFS